LILISSVFNSNIFLFKLQQPKFYFTIFFQPKNLSFPIHSILAACLISTTVSVPNSVFTQLARLVVFQLGSIQMSSNSGCRSSPHTATPLHPPVTPLYGNQEPPHMLLSPEMDTDPSSLLTKTEALNNSTHHRSFLLHDTVSPPSSAL
jgi:hypothetical protein